MGLSQKKLSLKADFDRIYLAREESGKANLPVSSFEKIVNVLDVSLWICDCWL